MIISFLQLVFSSLFYFRPIPLYAHALLRALLHPPTRGATSHALTRLTLATRGRYNGLLVLGYATLFTTGPVFSLVLDEDVSGVCISITHTLARNRPQSSTLPPVLTPSVTLSLVRVEDVSETNAMKFPELYRELQVCDIPRSPSDPDLL